MNGDDVHFIAKKQKSQFKLKAQVHPFISKTRDVAKEVDVLLKRMNFKFSLVGLMTH